MPLVSGIRASQVNRFWEASLAWKGVQGFGDNWTFQDILDRLVELRILQGPVSSQAEALLDDVIKDRRRRQSLEAGAQVYSFQRLIETSTAEPKSMVN